MFRNKIDGNVKTVWKRMDGSDVTLIKEKIATVERKLRQIVLGLYAYGTKPTKRFFKSPLNWDLTSNLSVHCRKHVNAWESEESLDWFQ